MRRAGTPFERRSLAVAAGYLVCLHTTLWWLAFGTAPRVLVGDEYGYFVAAHKLLAGQGLQLDPLWPPLYAYFLAALLRLGGEPLAVLAAAQSVLLLGTGAALATIVRATVGSPIAARWTFVATLGYPPLAAFTFYAWPEILHLALFTSALSLAIVGRERIAFALGSGLLLGVALLCKLILWPFTVVLALPWLSLRTGKAARCAVAALAAATAVVLALSPLLRPVGPPASLSANVGFNVWLGLNDTARRSFVDSVAGREYRAYLDSAKSPEDRARVLWGKIGRRVTEQGLATTLLSQLTRQPLRTLDHESFFTAQLPGGALADSKSGYGPVPAWLAFALRWWSALTYGALLSAAIAGAFVPRLATESAWASAWMRVFALFAAYNGLLFLALHVVSRYRIQLMPVLLIGCARTTAWLVEQRNAGIEPAAALAAWSPARRSLALAGIASALGLAFAGSIFGVR